VSLDTSLTVASGASAADPRIQRCALATLDEAPTG
jgi:hypothetical protein